jgi:hypothetical protein
VQALAAWLVARPHNAVIALALSVWLQALSFTSAIILVVLVLSKGMRRAMLDAMLALVLVVVAGLVAQAPLPMVVGGAIAIWLPALVLVTVLTRTRSLTLTLQMSVLLAIAVVTGIFLVAGNPVDYWLGYLQQIVDDLQSSNQFALAKWVEAQKEYADQMTMVAVFANWLVHSASLVMGYKLYRALPGSGNPYGRFRNLNLGKVIALVAAIASLLGMLTGFLWFEHVAFLSFGAFWLQGFAIVHWLYGQQMIPRIGLVLAYTMLLSVILSLVTVIGLAVFGYLDAWFRLRRPPKAA